VRTPKILSAIVVSAFALTACGDTVNISDDGFGEGVTVQATGLAKVVPDAVRVSLAVSAFAETNDVALTDASSTAAVVRDVLRDANIDDNDIATQTLSVNPEYRYSETEGQQLVGYRASQIFDVLIRDAANAGSVVDALVTRGGANVSINGTFPVVDDATDSVEAARQDAVEKARAKAEAYATLLGVELGDLVYLTEVAAPNNVVVGAKADAMAESAGTVIDLGSQEVSVTIEVRWKID
jgi:uncharacterized protein YggE